MDRKPGHWPNLWKSCLMAATLDYCERCLMFTGQSTYVYTDRRAVGNGDEVRNRQDPGAQDADCWAQHKASGDTIVKTNTLGADTRTRFKGTTRSYTEVLKSDAGVTDTEELTAYTKERYEYMASHQIPKSFDQMTMMVDHYISSWFKQGWCSVLVFNGHLCMLPVARRWATAPWLWAVCHVFYFTYELWSYPILVATVVYYTRFIIPTKNMADCSQPGSGRSSPCHREHA